MPNQNGRPAPKPTPLHSVSKRPLGACISNSCFNCLPQGRGPAGSKRGEVCRAFKVIPRSPCLTHRGAMLLCGELHRLPSLTLPRILLSPGSHRRAPASTVGFGSRSFLWQKESIQANTNHSERFQRRGTRRVAEGILYTRFCEDPWAPRLQRQSITS